MTPNTSAQSKQRSPLQRIRNMFPRSRTVSNQTNFESSTSPSAPKSTPLEPPSPAPAIAGSSSSHQDLTSDPGARPVSSAAQIVSPAGQCPSPASTLGQNLLKKALELLGEQEQAMIKEHITTEDIDSVLHDALMAAREKKKICESKRWTFSFRGCIVRLQDEADKIISWLNRFKQMGNIAVNADPIHAGLPWAGIRLLLEVHKCCI
jgi:hypothetical protein